MAARVYEEIEPHDEGMLDVGDGNRVHWEMVGMPGGKPAVVLHGGPGSGCAPWWRRLFDPHRYRVVLLDQRGCGRSAPSAARPDTDLTANTTHHLVSDLERLRAHLGIERWLVLGGSWGSTLALAYGARHTERISEMVLFSVTTTTRREVQWITRDVGRLFPEAWARFRDGVPTGERSDDLAAAYQRRLTDPDPAVRERAARDWCAWEAAIVGRRPGEPPDRRYDDPAFRMGFARLVTHYFSHAAWLPDGALLRAARGFGSIPAVLIHGRRDVSSPLDVPWQLSCAWPGSELQVVEDAGHGIAGPIAERVVAATDRFAT